MSYPPIPTNKSCNCSDPCISTDDVYYAGPNLPNSGINTYNVLTEVIEKLDAIYAVPTLQRVTEVGNYTTLPIIADSFVKIGGDGNNLLLDDGTVLPIGDLPTGVTETSQLINDGEDGINPFITALDIPTYTSSFINDGADGSNPYITLLDVPLQVVEADSYELFPEVGESNVVYITLDTYKLYIWQGYYVEVGLSVTNLSYVQGTTNGFVDNSNGSGAELLLADETYAGLLSPFDFVTLSNTSGTNTGDQNLQQVTDIGATTDNTITINPPASDNGLNINTTYVDGLGNSSAINLILAEQTNGIYVNASTQDAYALAVSGNSNSTSIYVNNSGTGIYLYNPETGLFISDAGNLNTGIYINNANGNYGVQQYQGVGTAEELNLGSTAKGLVINSGTSSTGNFIELNKNGVDKFTINQQGEQSIVKIPGGTSSQFLKANGTVDSSVYITAQTLQQVTNLGATTTNGITITPGLTGQGLTVYSSDENSTATMITAQTDYGTAIFGKAEDSGTGVSGFSDNGYAIKADTEAGIALYAKMGTFDGVLAKGLVIDSLTASTGNFIEFNKNNVNKLLVNQNGDITANSFIKDGGSSSEILMADGSIITAGNNITITGGQISSTGGGGGGGGGGSSVSYYLNGGTAASVAGYYQFNQSAVIGTGVDFSLTGNGLITQWLTDVGDPNKLEILGGNWNFETYMSISSVGGSTAFYIELLKYNGSTFTTIANNSGTPKLITSGTTIDVYFSSLAIPQTTLLTTDRLVLRYYIVDNTAGRTVTMYTQDSHLCQVITNFANGVIYLNGLNASSQNLAVGTTGSDFAINSSGSTHTFNLPTASASNRGALSSANWTTFNNKQNALSGTGLVRSTAGTISYDTSTYLTSVGISNLTATGTPGPTTFLRGDNTWATVGGGSGTVTSVTATAPVISSGGTAPVISMAAATASVSGYLTSGNFTIFNNKAGLDSPAFINSPTAPTQGTGLSNTTLATTAFVNNSINAAIPNIGYTIYNILIGNGTGMTNITTQEPGTSGGQPYAQNGRNVMINNGGSAIEIDATLAVDGFIASYTKLGSANITFKVTSPVVFLNNINGDIMFGSSGSTALLTKNGNTVYLLINNI